MAQTYTERPANAAAKASSRSDELRDLVFGAIGAAMVLGALVLLLFGGPRDSGVVRNSAPVLNIVQPTSGSVVSGPVNFIFDFAGEMERLPGGWGVGDLHIHLEVNGTEFMPGPNDIVRLPNGMYRWTLAGLPMGDHTARLFWAGPDHRAIAEGSSIPVTLRSR